MACDVYISCKQYLDPWQLACKHQCTIDSSHWYIPVKSSIHLQFLLCNAIHGKIISRSTGLWAICKRKLPDRITAAKKLFIFILLLWCKQIINHTKSLPSMKLHAGTKNNKQRNCGQTFLLHFANTLYRPMLSRYRILYRPLRCWWWETVVQWRWEQLLSLLWSLGRFGKKETSARLLLATGSAVLEDQGRSWKLGHHRGSTSGLSRGRVLY